MIARKRNAQAISESEVVKKDAELKASFILIQTRLKGTIIREKLRIIKWASDKIKGSFLMRTE